MSSEPNACLCTFSVFVLLFISGVARFFDARVQQSKWRPLTYYELKDYYYYYYYLFLPWRNWPPSGPGPPYYLGFTITLWHTTLGSIPLDEWPARHKDLYLTTHNTHNRQTSMPPVRFEPAIPANEPPQTHILGLAATGIGIIIYLKIKYPFYRQFASPWTLLPWAATPFAPPWLRPWCLDHANVSSSFEQLFFVLIYKGLPVTQIL